MEEKTANDHHFEKQYKNTNKMYYGHMLKIHMVQVSFEYCYHSFNEKLDAISVMCAGQETFMLAQENQSI